MNLQFTCQIALVKRFPQVAGEIHVPNTELAGLEQNTRLLFGSGCNTQCARVGLSPRAGQPPGQGLHLPALGDVTCKSPRLGDAGSVPPAVPGHASLQSGPCPLSPCAYSEHSGHTRCQGLGAWLLKPTFSTQSGGGCEGGRKKKKCGEAAQCWHALKADSFAPDVLNHMWRSVCGQMLLETDC